MKRILFNVAQPSRLRVSAASRRPAEQRIRTTCPVVRKRRQGGRTPNASRPRDIAARIFALAVLLSAITSASAETLLLKNAVVHTISGPTLSPGDVLIKDGRIDLVEADIRARADRTIDLQGRHLYPGLIAPTTALGLVEISAVRATRDVSEVGDYTPDVESWIAVNPDSELIPVARANGITHIQPVPQGGVVSGQSGVAALHGWTTEEMTIKGPAALHVSWPGMGISTTPKERFSDKSKWKSPDDQAKERREKIKELEMFFDEARAYAKAREAAAQNAQVRDPGLHPSWEAMLPYLRGELPVVVHANDVRQIRAAVNWAETNRLKLIITGGRDAWKAAELLAEKKVPVIYEHVFTLPPEREDGYDAQYKAPGVLHQAGVTVMFSEGAGTFQAGLVKNLPYAAAQAVAFGLPEEEALRGMTLYPAQALGVSERLGSIEPGKEATLFVADGNILDIRANVTMMWIAGQEVSLESRHTRLFEKYSGRPKP